MSYTIWYRTLFVKVSNERFIPLFENGDNNVWECETGRRSRSWNHYVTAYLSKDPHRLPFVHEQELVDAIAKKAKDFEYYGTHISGKSITTCNDYINYWKRGCRRAKTFEELANAGIHLEVKDCNWCDSDKPHYTKMVNNEEELVEAWNECVSLCGNAMCRPIGKVSEWEYKRLYPPKPKATKQHEKGYVVAFGYDYVTKMSARRLWHNSYLPYAKKYTSRSAAEKVVERLKSRWTLYAEPKVIEVHKDKETGTWKQAA